VLGVLITAQNQILCNPYPNHCIRALSLFNWLCYLPQLVPHVVIDVPSRMEVPNNNSFGLQVTLFFDYIWLIMK
jgi:hypothetical protein